MSDDEFLLKRQRVELAQAILAQGFQATAFTEGYWPGDVVGWDPMPAYAVTYSRRGRFSFPIRERDASGSNFNVLMRPGRQTRSELIGGATWSNVLGLFDLWLNAVRLELDLPSAWADLAAYGAAARGSARPVDNTPFTAEEQRQLRQQLDRILGTVEFNEAQLTVVRAELDYLKGAAATSGRRDWALMALGVLASWALSTVLPPDKISEIWQYVQPFVETAGVVGFPLLLKP